jgi:hypothetical protein
MGWPWEVKRLTGQKDWKYGGKREAEDGGSQGIKGRGGMSLETTLQFWGKKGLKKI